MFILRWRKQVQFDDASIKCRRYTTVNGKASGEGIEERATMVFSLNLGKFMRRQTMSGRYRLKWNKSHEHLSSSDTKRNSDNDETPE